MFVVDVLKEFSKSISRNLQDPGHPLLGIHLKLLKCLGIWHPVMDSITRLKLVIVYVTLGFFVTQYIKCCINISVDAVSVIFQYAPYHVVVFKIAIFLKDHKKWSELFAYIKSVELQELSRHNTETKGIMGRYIKHSYCLTLLYWVVAFFTSTNMFRDFYGKINDSRNASEEYLKAFDGYTPWNRERPGCYYIFATQQIFVNIVTVYIIAWDQLVYAILIFFAAQLRIFSIHCKQAVKVDDAGESLENIKESHRFYIALVKNQETFNSLISPAMFLYLIVISVNLGICITEIVELQNDPKGLLAYFPYVLACLQQLLLLYWHSNEVTEQSLLVSYSAYESEWIESNQSVRNEIILLAHTTSKRLAFTAGPFNEMSLATFVSILRGSYSFYTLLNETN